MTALRTAWPLPALCAAFATLLASSAMAAKDPLVRVEPPSPLSEKSWQQVRSEQISFMERLKLWGIAIEVEKESEGKITNTPDVLTLKGGWKSPDEFSLTMGIKVPEVIRGYEFQGEYKFEAYPEATAHSENFALAFNGAKVSGEIKSASNAGLGYEIAGEFEKGLVGFKTAIGSKGSSYEFSIPLGTVKGVGKVKLKLGPLKYGQRFVEFVPRFVDVAKAPAQSAAEAAVSAVQVQLNPGLAVAALANDVTIWIDQMRREKSALEAARQGIVTNFIEASRKEASARRAQAAEAQRAVQLVDSQESLYKQRSPELRSRYEEYLRLAQGRSRPLLPIPPAVNHPGQDVDTESDGETSSGGRTWERETDTPRESHERNFEFRSRTFDYLRSGGGFD